METRRKTTLTILAAAWLVVGCANEPTQPPAARVQTVPERLTEVFVYPSQGQSEMQLDRDRYECHLWSVDQTQFDPSMGYTDAAQSGEYRRATTACLEGRGYTVR